jgi:hypothetical protein
MIPEKDSLGLHGDQSGSPLVGPVGLKGIIIGEQETI